MYDPRIGRFISTDPSGFSGGDANLYRYVGNDPLNKVDPTGLSARQNVIGGGNQEPEASYFDAMAGNYNLRGTAAYETYNRVVMARFGFGSPTSDYEPAIDFGLVTSGLSYNPVNTNSFGDTNFNASLAFAMPYADSLTGVGDLWSSGNYSNSFHYGDPGDAPDTRREAFAYEAAQYYRQQEAAAAEMARNQPSIGPYHGPQWTIEEGLAANRRAERSVAFDPENEFNSKYASIRGEIYREHGGMFALGHPSPPRSDVQAVLKFYSAVPVAGAPAALVDAGIHAYNREYESAAIAGLPFIAVPLPASASTGVARSFGSYSALKRALGPAGEGKVWHHIVEQRATNAQRFGPALIHNTENVVRVPARVNQQIADFYSSKRRFTGGQTVREWLTSQSYEKAT